MTTALPLLLVDDDPFDVELTLRALRDIAINNPIDIVRDGADALDYLFRRGNYEKRVSPLPCVVLLDLKLPKVNGLDVLKQIRDDPHLRLLPVVILTSSNQEKDLAAAYSSRCNAYVIKPVDPDQFHRAVRELGLFWALTNQAPPTYV